MAQRMIRKIEATDSTMLARLEVKLQDAMSGRWGAGEYDVVVLGANALYELPSGDMQKRCIQYAYQALKPGGKLLLDNDNWRKP